MRLPADVIVVKSDWSVWLRRPGRTTHAERRSVRLAIDPAQPACLTISNVVRNTQRTVLAPVISADALRAALGQALGSRRLGTR